MHNFETEMSTFLLQNGALWDIGLVHCVISEIDLLCSTVSTYRYVLQYVKPFFNMKRHWGIGTEAINSVYLCLHIEFLKFIQIRNHFGYGFNQWPTTLQCNVVSHCLNPCPEWSLQKRCTKVEIRFSRSDYGAYCKHYKMWCHSYGW